MHLLPYNFTIQGTHRDNGLSSEKGNNLYVFAAVLIENEDKANYSILRSQTAVG